MRTNRRLFFVFAAIFVWGADAAAQCRLPLRRPVESEPAAHARRPLRRHIPLANLQHLGPAADAALAAKVTAPTERLIASSGYDEMGSLRDTVRYFYSSAARGSSHGANDIQSYYLSGYTPDNENKPSLYGLLQGGPLAVRYDSAVSFYEGEIDQAFAAQYNAASHLTAYRTHYYSSGTLGATLAYAVSRTPAGLPAEVESEILVPGSPPLSFGRTYSRYDAGARPLVDSVVSLLAGPGSRYEYSYTGTLLTRVSSFYDTGTGPFENARYDITYDAAGRLQTATGSYLGTGSGPGLAPYGKDSFGYTGALPFYTYVAYTTFDSTNPGFSVEYTVNAQNLRDTARYYDEAGALMETDAYTYNAAGNLTRVTGDDLSTPTSPDFTDYFYFETYDPATSISDAAPRPTLQALASPNPVFSALSVGWKADALSGPTAIRLADAAGRTLLVQTVSGAAGTAGIDMSRYAPGIYMVTLTAAGGAPLQSLRVVKL